MQHPDCAEQSHVCWAQEVAHTIYRSRLGPGAELGLGWGRMRLNQVAWLSTLVNKTVYFVLMFKRFFF